MEITKQLKLPFQFDAQRLERELEVILEHAWKPHFNRQGYTGSWKSIALYSKDGKASNIFTVIEKEEELVLKETPIMKDYPYLRTVIKKFNCPLLSVRLLKLDSGAVIKPHKDFNLGYENDNFRLHIPIKTNDKVEFLLDGELVKMDAGECWYTNVNYTHSVKNQGMTDRIHLVIDGKRNDWSDQLFFSLAAKESFFPPQGGLQSKEHLLRTIEELKRLDPPCPKAILEDLEQQLQTFETRVK